MVKFLDKLVTVNKTDRSTQTVNKTIQHSNLNFKRNDDRMLCCLKINKSKKTEPKIKRNKKYIISKKIREGNVNKLNRSTYLLLYTRAPYKCTPIVKLHGNP